METAVNTHRLFTALLLCLLLAGAVLASEGGADTSLVEVCNCDTVLNCTQHFVNSFLPCLDSCEKHASRLGANYTELRRCFQRHNGKFKTTLRCVQDRFEDSCLRRGKPVEKIPHRDWDGITLGAFDEVTKVAKNSGVEEEARKVLAAGKKFYLCAVRCMDKRSGDCVRGSKCSLKFPSDAEVVQTGKKCAIENGFNSGGMRELCECVEEAGVK